MKVACFECLAPYIHCRCSKIVTYVTLINLPESDHVLSVCGLQCEAAS